MRRILVVSHEHPPSPGIGGSRWVSMTRYLRERDYQATVVASSAWGTLPNDEQDGVIRVRDLRGSSLLRKLLRRGKLRVAGDLDLVERPPTALLTQFLVPELSVVAWLPQLVTAVRRTLGEQHFDCLITTSPPESSHLVGLCLGHRRPAWLADFRDGWTFEPWHPPFPTKLQRTLDRRLERRVAESADVVVGATRPIATDLAERLNARAGWVPNGWDPAFEPQNPQAQSSNGSAFTLAYTGTLIGPRQPDLRPLLRALSFVNSDPLTPPVRLVHAGRLTTLERQVIEQCGAGEFFEHLGTVDRRSALALQRSADALLLVTSNAASEATGKLFEYLGAGRPILALADGNEAARIVKETGTGITVSPDDVGAIAAAIRQLVTHRAEDIYAPHDLERFVYPGPADAMAELIERAIERRGRARR